MKRIKGLVVEVAPDYTFLLTQEGDYIKVPNRGQEHEIGDEIEIQVKDRRFPVGHVRRLGWVASIVLVIGLLFVMKYFAESPAAAYLDLDVNPSLSLQLDEDGQVMGSRFYNEEGEVVLDHAQKDKLEGQKAGEALEQVLDACLELGYLSREEQNRIFVSLAASDDYPLSQEEIESFVKGRILAMELDSYLKVSRFGLEDAEKARGMDVSLNAVELGSRIQDWRSEEGIEPGEAPGPPAPVQELLKEVPAGKILEELEFVGGREKPDEQEDDRGRPDGVPPVQTPGGEKNRQERKDSGSKEDEPSTPPTPQPPDTEDLPPIPLPEERDDTGSSSSRPGKEGGEESGEKTPLHGKKENSGARPGPENAF